MLLSVPSTAKPLRITIGMPLSGAWLPTSLPQRLAHRRASRWPLSPASSSVLVSRGRGQPHTYPHAVIPSAQNLSREGLP